MVQKHRRRSCHYIPVSIVEPNAILDETLSVKTILKYLNLSNLNSIFEREEVSSKFECFHDVELSFVSRLT
jgi:hypothetical protein